MADQSLKNKKIIISAGASGRCQQERMDVLSNAGVSWNTVTFPACEFVDIAELPPTGDC